MYKTKRTSVAIRDRNKERLREVPQIVAWLHQDNKVSFAAQADENFFIISKKRCQEVMDGLNSHANQNSRDEAL